ncbi:hypothetical protein BgiBS90_005268, partial [Biomphalaria glabrata]
TTCPRPSARGSQQLELHYALLERGNDGRGASFSNRSFQENPRAPHSFALHSPSTLFIRLPFSPVATPSPFSFRSLTHFP